MKTLLASTAALLLTVSVACAQTATATSNSQSGAISGSRSASISQGGTGGNATGLAYNGGNQINFAGAPQRTRQTVDYTGDYTVRNAPQVVAPSMSSGHPCAFSPASISLSVIGAGAGAGGQRIDDACLLGQMGLTNEALIMIASRNTDACVALRATGRISAQSVCGGKQLRQPSAPAARPATVAATKSAAPAIARGSVVCGQRDGKLLVQHRPGVDRNTAIAYCRQQG